MSRPGGRTNGIIKALNGDGYKGEQTTSGNRKGVSPSDEVEKLKVSRDGARGNAHIRNPIDYDRQPIARN